MTDSTQNPTFVGIFASHATAAAAIKALDAAGIKMRKLSILDENLETGRRPPRPYTSGDRLKFWGACGAFLKDPRGNDLWERILHSPRPQV